MRKRALLLASLLVSSSLLAAPSIVDLGTRKVRIRTEGSGPSVVFEAGLRSTLDSWNKVLPDVAKFARVFAYDRAGLGGSDPVSGERNYLTLAAELHQLLKHEKVPPPYLFVGHSYGGVLARVFYKQYANEISGVVFVDPMNEVFINNDPDREKNLARQDSSVTGAPPGVVAEWQYLKAQAADHFSNLRKYGAPNVPMALIVATIDRPPGWRASAMDVYGAWLTARNDSLIVVTPNSGHLVMRDEPSLVTNAIRSLLYPNPVGPVLKASAKGADSAIAVFRDELARYPKDAITPTILNTVGYSLLRNKATADAIKVFALNVATFPADANGYDSLGEAYLASGNTAAALKNYRRSLELDPTNENAKRIIARLKQAQK